MKREKSVLLMVIFLAIVFGLVLSVNAGWWNTITGKASAKVNVTVSASSSPAVITFVSFANRSTTGGNDLLSCYSKTAFNFTLIAYHSSGLGNLHGDISGEDVTSDIIGNFTYGSNTRFISRCAYKNDIGTYRKNYTCSVDLEYFDEPNVDWTINVAINSTGGAWSLTNNTQKFKIKPSASTSVDTNPGTINWTRTGITIGDSNKIADNNVTIINCGNTEISTAATTPGDVFISAIAKNLTGRGLIPTDQFPSADFTAREWLTDVATTCGAAGNLTDAVSVKNITFALSNSGSTVGTAASKPLVFCIYKSDDVPSPQTYASDIDWQVIANVVV